MSDDHDHSGDHLGDETPVESINVNTVTIHDFDTRASYLVYPDGDTWFALRTADQTIVDQDADGIKVVNRAVAALGEQSNGVGGSGVVRVTAPEEDFLLKSPTPIELTTDGVSLVMEPRFRHGGDVSEAVLVAGDNIRFEFTVIESGATDYGFRDLGLSNSTIRGHLLIGPDRGLWYGDADNQVHPTPPDAGYTHVEVEWAHTRQGPFGIKLTSAPDARFANYRFKLPILFPGDTGVVFGDRSEAQSVHDNVFIGDIDAASGGSERLVEINDRRNAVYLKDFTPGSASEDVVIRPSAGESTVLPLTARSWPTALRVRREAKAATDFSKFDPFRAEIVRYDLFPDSLDGYAVEGRGTGSVALRSGHVEQSTGTEAGSWSTVRRRVAANYGRLSFGHFGFLQTNVQVADNADQEAWLVWGDREGPGVGWHVIDDRLEGYVHDGDVTHTVPLRTGFDPGESWNLAAFYNPSAGVQYYVGKTATGETSTLGTGGNLELSAVATFAPPSVAVEATIEATPAEGSGTEVQVMAIDLTNDALADKSVRWSTWRNYQYPRSQ